MTFIKPVLKENKINPDQCQGLTDLLEMVNNNTYKCDYPNDPDINNIVTSTSAMYIESRYKEKGISYFHIGRNSDIIKQFDLHGKINHVYITIGNKTVYSQFYDEATDVIISPFTFGIPVIALLKQEIIIYVVGECDSLVTTYLYLDTYERRDTANRKIVIDNVTIYKGKWHQDVYLDEYYAKDECLKYITDPNSYYCAYPTNPDVDDIIAKNIIRKGISYYLDNNTYNTYKYEIFHSGTNIIKEFIFETKISEFTLYIGGIEVYHEEIDKTKAGVTIRPFTFGIPTAALMYHNVDIKVKADTVPIMFINSLKLSKSDNEYLATTSFAIEINEKERTYMNFESGIMRLDVYPKIYRKLR